MRPHDTIARLGGDTFALIVDSGGTDVLHLARGVLASFDRPFAVEGLSTVISASVGVSVFPKHGSDAATLLRHADVAVTAAKQQSAGVSFYEPGKDPFSPERLGLTAELRAGIAGGQLVLHFQPIVSVSSTDPDSAEALVRWLHPTRGMIPPGDFIPAAERTGLIKILTEWVLNNAAKQAAEWARAGRAVPISVNISMRNLVDPEFAEVLARALAAHVLDPSLLRLELTESVAMADPESTLAMLAHVRAQGVRLSIDDFGTGYSSLAYLRRLPVDTLKIDRTFVTAMRADPRSASIVRGATELAHGLGLRVVAEGVEDEETLGTLRELGCDFAQGYHLGRPMPAHDFVVWHEARRSAARRVGF
jgi:EAL domain-containing protein (putative c-di-GMP-specific phosphodiesterase class I)